MDIIYRYDPYRPIVPRQLEDADAAIEMLARGHERHVTIVTQVHRELVGDRSTGPIVIPSDPLSLGLPLSSGAPPVQTPFALVLGHSSCGAVSAAVDSYLAPRDYASIAFTHALRSLVDRIQVAVRGAAAALDRLAGPAAQRHAEYKAALVEAAVYLNAAITAYDVRREVDRLAAPSPRVVYGVFDLVQQRVRARPAGAQAEGPGQIPVFADVPSGPDDFGTLGAEIARAVVARRLQPRPAGARP